MKKLFTIFNSLLLCVAVQAQTAITINATDVPIPSGAFNLLQLGSLPANPSLGNNQNWDYGTYVGTASTSASYIAETDPFFTNAGIDIYRNASKNLTPSLYYDIAYELDFNANKVEEKGMYVYPQGYALTNFTGSSADSLTFPVQGFILPNTRTLLNFPFTANSAWHSSARHSVDFNLSVAAYGLNKTPGKHVFNLVENDTIVGWGKMTVHTAGGNSIPYDVLMERSEFYALDSFYLGGAPAPTALLTGFGISQGQKTGVFYAYNFLMKGTYSYLMRQNYGADSSFSTMSEAYTLLDGVNTTAIDDKTPLYSTLLYPNPSNGLQLNVQILGKELVLSTFTVMDLMGRTVQEGTPESIGNGTVRVSLSENLVNGTYLIKMKDRENRDVVTEKFDLRK